MKSDSDFDKCNVKIKCLDKKNKTIKIVKSAIDHDGKYKIPLKKVSKIKAANLTVYNKNGDKVFTKFTSKFKVTKKVTKDQPIKKKKSSSSSSDSSVTYWLKKSMGVIKLYSIQDLTQSIQDMCLVKCVVLN